MKDIFSVDFRDAIRKVVRSELKDKFGIKPNKDKNKQLTSASDSHSKYFGVPLEDIPSKSVKDDQYFNIPRFLAESLEYLNDHLKVEGLFRKSGSVGRQKVLRELLEKNGSCCSFEFVQPHDIAALVKQFFRELPDPLLTRRLCPAFLKCITLNQSDCIPATALCCLLLPDEHLRVLKYFVDFISEMANHSLESKMTLSNLAIIFAPNLTINCLHKEKNGEKTLKDYTQIVDLIFKNAHLIGMVPDALFNKAMTMNQEGGFCSSSGDELEAGDDHPGRGRSLQRSDKKRDRSKSITGFLRRNFKTNEKSSGNSTNNKHVRSCTCEKTTISRENLLQDPSSTDSVKEFGDPVWKQQSNKPITKRRNNSKTNMSPVRKSPRLSSRDLHNKHPTPPVISLPKLKSVPHQVISTPRRLLQPIHNQDTTRTAAVLPSKYGLPTASKARGAENLPHKHFSPNGIEGRHNPRLTRSKSSTMHHSSSAVHGNSCTKSTTTITATTTITTDTTDQQHVPQPKLSRATQKPHVRKNRRQSSMERRRARYASASQRIRRLPKVPSEKSISERDEPFPCDEFLTTPGEEATKKDEEARSRPRTSFKSPDLNGSIGKPETNMRPCRRLPKTNSATACLPPPNPSNSSNPVTPEKMKMKRSTSSSYRKPATPYNVTPQVGARRSSKTAAAFVASRTSFLL